MKMYTDRTKIPSVSKEQAKGRPKLMYFFFHMGFRVSFTIE